MKHAFGFLGSMLVGGLVALLASGCGGPEYSETDISAVVSSFGGASDNQANTVTVNHITITEGHLVKAHIEVKNDDDESMGLVVKSDNASVVDVQYVTTPDDFAFFATAVGETEIRLIADGTLVLTINATVVPQPSPE